MFDWKSQKRKLFLPIACTKSYGLVFLQNKRIDDFVCLQKLISSFLTPDNTQLSWILTKLLKFKFIFWVLRIGILLLQKSKYVDREVKLEEQTLKRELTAHCVF